MMRTLAFRRWVWVATLMLCVLGAGVSWALSQKHIRHGFGEGSLLGRLCEDGTASCDEVIRSRWGTVLGVPTAVWGEIYFVGFGLWCALVGLANRAGMRWHLPAVAAATAGLLIAAALDYHMFAVLPNWCPLCLVTHILSLLLFVAALLLWPPPEIEPSAAPASPTGVRVMVTCVAILIGALAVHENFQHRRFRAETAEALRLFEQSEMARPALGTRPTGDARSPEQLRSALAACEAELAPMLEVVSNLVQKTDAQEKRDAALQVDDPRKGNAASENVAVVFSDFECPNCYMFATTWRDKIEPGALDKVNFVFRYFPMNTACNTAVRTTLHAESCRSAYAAEAARLLGGNEAFWKMHDELFANQVRTGTARLAYRQLAEKCGLDGAKFEAEMNSPRVREKIAADVQLGRQLGVKATPIVFLNGRQLPAPLNERLWRHYLKYERVVPASRPAK